VSAIVSNAASGTNQPSTQSSSTSQPSAAAAAAKSVAPAPSKAAALPTANPQIQLVVAYTAAAANTGPLVAAFNADGADCGTDIATCRADLQATIAAIDSYESGLNKVQVPTCLQQADRDIRLGLALVKQGSQQAINGIDAVDASQINAGTALILQGTQSINTASSEVTSAHCP
jgi:hypothetical protein